jgi:two-component system response regulator FlrC
MFTSRIELVGSHPKFRKALDFAANVAVTKSPALIVGETGTGKKALCEFIHANSNRRNAEIRYVDCSQDAISVENTILGYREEGTGKFNKGILELANGGTVVFANIDGLEEAFQKRLFTIFQELADYDLDVRLLATTTKNLSKFVGAGRFHRALYTYFSSTQINLTPLRERGTDIELIARYLADKKAIECQLNPLQFSEEALNKINNFYWTHNVTELKTVIENAVENRNDNLIDINAIELGEKKAESITVESDEDGMRLMSLKEAEKLLIKKALIHTSENRTQAAKILGVSIRTLRNKINEYRNEGTNYFVNLR